MLAFLLSHTYILLFLSAELFLLSHTYILLSLLNFFCFLTHIFSSLSAELFLLPHTYILLSHAELSAFSPKSSHTNLPSDVALLLTHPFILTQFFVIMQIEQAFDAFQRTGLSRYVKLDEVSSNDLNIYIF
jgi:hypothetical protein